MTRGRAARLGPFVVLLVVATLLVALLLEIGWHAASTRSWSAALPVAARTLFFFGDIAFYLWLPFLVVAALRRRRRPTPWAAFLALLAGGVLNVLVVAVIGFAQTGGAASFVAIAVEGSLAAVLAGALVIPALYRGTTWGAGVAGDPQAEVARATPPTRQNVGTGREGPARGLEDIMGIDDIVDKAKDIAGDVAENVSGFAADAVENTKEFVGGAVDAVKDAAHDVASKVADATADDESADGAAK